MSEPMGPKSWIVGPIGQEYERNHRDDPLYAGQAGAFALHIDALIYEEVVMRAPWKSPNG